MGELDLFKVRYREIMRSPSPEERDRLLVMLMYDLELTFGIPISPDWGWKEANRDVWRFYEAVSDSRVH